MRRQEAQAILEQLKVLNDSVSMLMATLLYVNGVAVPDFEKWYGAGGVQKEQPPISKRDLRGDVPWAADYR